MGRSILQGLAPLIFLQSVSASHEMSAELNIFAHSFLLSLCNFLGQACKGPGTILGKQQFLMSTLIILTFNHDCGTSLRQIVGLVSSNDNTAMTWQGHGRKNILFGSGLPGLLMVKQDVSACQVDIYPGDIVNCPKGKDGAHSVESLTDDITFLVANK